MRKVLALLAVMVLIAGCVGQSASQPATQGSPAKTPTETTSTPPGVGVTVTSAPANVLENTRFQVSWNVFAAQPTAIAGTLVYYGGASHAGAAPTALPPSTFNYQSYTPTQKGVTPASMTDYVLAGSAAGDSPGKLYFRAYAIIDNLNYWSDEYVVDVYPRASINVTSYPSTATASASLPVSWTIKNGYPGKIDSTYVMWGLRSGQYTSTSAAQAGNTPTSFSATLTAPSSAPQTFYFLVTYTVDGQNYNSTEYSIPVKA
jgi:hypothetical protein